jgi:hypothetical protein
MGPSGRGQWYGVEAGCYKELTPGLEPEEQQVSAVSNPDHDHDHPPHYSPEPSYHQIGQHNSDTNTQRTSEQPATQSTLELLREGGDGWSGDQLAEFEKEVETGLRGPSEVIVGDRTQLSTPAPSLY